MHHERPTGEHERHRERPQLSSGTDFVLPPPHRLFCILDGPARVAAVLDAVEAAPGVHVDSVLVFEGPEGAHALERGAIGHHPASLLRVAQRLLTGDGEYREAIAGDVASGAVALALHVPPDEVDAATAVLERVGARHLAYTAHWNFNDPHRAPRVA